MIEPYWKSADGRHVIYNADCLQVLPELEAGSIDAAVTSPPYNQLGKFPSTLSALGMWGESSGGAGFVNSWNGNGYIDDMPEADYQSMQKTIFECLLPAIKNTGSLFYNHQIRWRDGAPLHPVSWFKPSGWMLRSEIIWDRGGGMMMNSRMFCRYDERILWFVTSDRYTWNQAAVGYGTIWRIAREQQQQGKLHPVAFPVEVPFRCIVATTTTGGLVIDPFCGSGTTGVACVRTNRRFVGIEIEKRYCDIAVKRMERELSQPMLPFAAPEEKAEQATMFDETEGES